MAIILGRKPGGTGGGVPSGPAGGDLTGTYPNPSIAAGSVEASMFAAGLKPWTELFDETKLANAATFDTGAGGFSTALDHLLVVCYLRTTEVIIISSAQVTINNDSGGNYDEQQVRGRDTTAVSGDTQAVTFSTVICPGASAAAGVFSANFGLIPAYAQTTGEKAGVWVGSFADEAATGGDALVKPFHWRNTAAISRIILTAGGGANFLAGSRLTVYGIG